MKTPWGGQRTVKGWNGAWLAAVILSFCLISGAQGQTTPTITWVDEDGQWTEAAKWSPPRLPTESDDVLIDREVVVTFQNLTATINTLTLDGGAVLRLVSGELRLLAGCCAPNQPLLIGTGHPGTSAIIQTGGNLLIPVPFENARFLKLLVVGFSSPGAYILSGGKVQTEDLRVEQQGTFQQRGGEVNANRPDPISEGGVMGLEGLYTLTNGSLSTKRTRLSGFGTFRQRGGTHETITLSIGPSATYELRGGTLKVVNERVAPELFGTPVSNSGRFVYAGGSIEIDQFVPRAFMNDGMLVVQGTRSLDGVFTQSAAGTMVLTIRDREDFDQLEVSGKLTLGGVIRVMLADGFSPAFGARFDLLTAATITDFDPVNFVLPVSMDNKLFRVELVEGGRTVRMLVERRQ